MYKPISEERLADCHNASRAWLCGHISRELIDEIHTLREMISDVLASTSEQWIHDVFNGGTDYEDES